MKIKDVRVLHIDRHLFMQVHTDAGLSRPGVTLNEDVVKRFGS